MSERYTTYVCDEHGIVQVALCPGFHGLDSLGADVPGFTRKIEVAPVEHADALAEAVEAVIENQLVGQIAYREIRSALTDYRRRAPA